MISFSNEIFTIIIVQKLLFSFIDAQTRQSCLLTQNTNLTNHVSDSWMFREVSVYRQFPSSILECAYTCLEDKRCVTFMVNNNTKLCRLHAVRISEFYSLEPADGFLSFDTCRADDYIGHPCDTDTACSLNNTECVEHTCQCQAGYSFSPTLNSCVTDCSEYGPEFVGFPDWYISRHNTKELNDTESTCPGCCRKRCREETSFRCRSLEAMSTKCMLADVTKNDVPNDYHYHTSFNIVHYQRQCSYDD